MLGLSLLTAVAVVVPMAFANPRSTPVVERSPAPSKAFNADEWNTMLNRIAKSSKRGEKAVEMRRLFGRSLATSDRAVQLELGKQLLVKLAAHPGSKTARRLLDQNWRMGPTTEQAYETTTKRRLGGPSSVESSEDCGTEYQTEYMGETFEPDEEGCLTAEEIAIEQAWSAAIVAENSADMDELSQGCEDALNGQNGPLDTRIEGDCEEFIVLSNARRADGPSFLEDGTPCISGDSELPFSNARHTDFDACMDESAAALAGAIALVVGERVYYEATKKGLGAKKMPWKMARWARAGLYAAAFYAGYQAASAAGCWASAE
jgi:hypothetical protein